MTAINISAGFSPELITRQHLTQMYQLMLTTMGVQNDSAQVLGFMIAVTAASRCTNKYQANEMVEQVIEIATLALDEICGLRPMPLQRPDDDQMAELIRAVTAARAANGLGGLPSLH